MYRGDGEILEETSDEAEHPLTVSGTDEVGEVLKLRNQVRHANQGFIKQKQGLMQDLFCKFQISGKCGWRESVKLRIQTDMLGLKSCEALASTCRLRRSLGGCLWRSGRSRRVWSRAEKKLKADESKLGKVGC